MQDEKLLCGYLRTTIVDMALYFAPVESLAASLTELKKDRKVHVTVLGVLQELATHSSFQVRRYVAILYGVCTLCICTRFFSHTFWKFIMYEISWNKQLSFSVIKWIALLLSYANLKCSVN